MRTATFNPVSWTDAADFADEHLLKDGKPGEQVDVEIASDANPGLVAWLFGRVDEFNKYLPAGKPKLLIEGVSYNPSWNVAALVSFQYRQLN